MRATRVLQTPNSIFHNSRQYLHSNEQIFRVMQEGELGQFSGGQGNRKRKKRQERIKSPRKVVLKTNPNSLAVNGLRFDAVSVASLRNYLLKHCEKIEKARKKVTRIHAYRSSI